MGNQKLIYAGVAALVALALVVIIWPRFKPEEPPAIVIEAPELEKFVIPESVAPEPTVAPTVAPEPELPLAPQVVSPPANLSASDDAAREAALDLSVQLGRWLMPAEQVRKWVVFIDRAAEGDLLSKHRPWDIKLGAYAVTGSEAAPRSTIKNYQRYDKLINAVDSIAVDKLAYYLEQWTDILDQAYQELGQGGQFQERVLMALDQVIAAEPLSASSTRLVRPSVMYKYADVRLESASDIQKLLWRMGPDNTAKIQRVARDLREYLLSPPEYQSGF